MPKLIFIDVEATGNGKHPGHTILNLAALIVDKGVVVDQINLFMKPKKNCLVEFHKTLYKDMLSSSSSITQEEGYRKFVEFLSKHVDRYDPISKLIGVAYNSEVEFNHLNRWFNENGNKYLASFIIPPFVCVQQLSIIALNNIIPILKKRTLRSIAECLDIPIEIEKLHTAYYDALICKRVFYSLMKRLKKMPL